MFLKSYFNLNVAHRVLGKLLNLCTCVSFIKSFYVF